MKIQANEIQLIEVDRIIPNPKNANKHSPEQIKRLEKLISFQGFRNPLIISKRSGFLIVGHGRLEAAKNLGIDKLPVIYQDFENEAQEYAYLISDNEVARWAELDKELVLEEIKDLELDDIELLGLKDFEVFQFQNDENEQEEPKEKSKEFILEIKFPNEMEMRDIHDDMLTRGYMVKIRGE